MDLAQRPLVSPVPPPRRVFCNRTLNLRRIRAVGFDMDYTLVHYHAERWEERAWEYARRRLGERGLPVEGLAFDPRRAMLGLVIDTELGNLVKANRFGYVKAAVHGDTPLQFEAQRATYGRELIDLREDRWVFLNTLFSLSEACLYSQLVERLDQGMLGTGMSYRGLYKEVRSSLDEAHMEGLLKAEIIGDKAHYVVPDDELVTTLLDLKHAGKHLLILTNSEWPYTEAMMEWALAPWLPEGMAWRDLFDLIFVDARKPRFFTDASPLLEVVEPGELMRYVRPPLQNGRVYSGGSAGLVEEHFGLDGDEMLFVGDHIFTDVNISKKLLRWRTCLVLRDLEQEIEAMATFEADEHRLEAMMDEKTLLEEHQGRLRRDLQRIERRYGPAPARTEAELRAELEAVRQEITRVDRAAAPYAKQNAELMSARWGLLTRTGNDKSHLARQIERYADIYLSRVSNLAAYGPSAFFRSAPGRLPHALAWGRGMDR